MPGPHFLKLVWPSMYYWMQEMEGGEPPEHFWMLSTCVMV